VPDVPDITRLQQAHERLTSAYVEVHRQAETDRWVRPIADDHLRRRTRALHDAYLHAAATTFRSEGDQKWLVDEAEALQRLESTFRSRRNLGRLVGGANMVIGLPGVLWLLSITGVSAGALALLDSCLCHLIGLVPWIATLTIVFTLCVAFFRKRSIFKAADTGAEGGVYGVENEVFGALGIEKEREPPVDLHGWALITVIWIVATVIEVTASGRLYETSREWLFWTLLVLAAGITVVTYFSARLRQPA